MTDSGNRNTLRLPKTVSKTQKTARKRAGARARAVEQRRLSSEQPPGRPRKRPASQKPSPVAHKHSPNVATKQAAESGASLQNIALIKGPNFPLFIPCPRGLEETLKNELLELGFNSVQLERSGCALETNWEGAMRINLYSRIATRILLKVGMADVRQENDIYELAMQIAWEEWFGPKESLRVDTSAIQSPMRSLQYCNLLAKDAICDRLRNKEGARPSVDTVRPDARVHLFLDQSNAHFYLDTSGESLFKRGWRFSKGEAPIRENLAAGMLALSNWNPEQALLDPFCGSGTILVEAATIAYGLAPGRNRPFAFQRLRNYQPELWKQLIEEAENHSKATEVAPIYGSDLDPAALEAAKQNIDKAGLPPDAIQLQIAEASTLRPPAPEGHIITNPPYGERLSQSDAAFWDEFASNLKQHFHNWQLNIISSDFELPQKMRLRPRRRHPLFNGPLDCRLFVFDIVAQQYRP